MTRQNEQVRFRLRVNSPAFVGGAAEAEKRRVRLANGTKESTVLRTDPGGIRIPGLRGALEFWYRTRLGTLQPKEIFLRQGARFGSATRGQGIGLRYDGRSQFRLGELKFDAAGRVSRFAYDMLYLGYGPLQYVKPAAGDAIVSSHNATTWRDAICVPPENSQKQHPEIGFVARIGSDEQASALRTSLLLLHLFGGVGARSRRGWGSVGVEADWVPAIDDDEEPAEWIQRILPSALSRVDGAATVSEKLPRFTAWTSGARIAVTPWIGKGSYRNVLQAFAARFGECRRWRGNGPPGRLAREDHDLEAHDARQGEAARQELLSGVPKRLAYGLPYAPRFSSHEEIEYFGESEDGPITRRASPLFLKVHHVPGRGYFGVALFLPAAFFGGGDYEIGAWLGRGRNRVRKNGTQPFPGFSAVEAFFDLGPSSTWSKVSLPSLLGS